MLHLASILVDEELSRGEIQVSPSQTLNGVWATRDVSAESQNWARLSLVDKTEVRLSLNDTAGFEPWADFAREAAVDPAWFIALNEAGGPTVAGWFVNREPVSMANVGIEIRRASDGVYQAMTPAAAKKRCLGVADDSLDVAEVSAKRLPPFRQRDAMVWLRKTRRQMNRLRGVEPSIEPVKEKFKWVAAGPWYS